MLFPNDKLIIFAKAPIPGQVKKRLIPALGKKGATKLHQEMLEQKLRLTHDNNIAPVELHCWPDTDHSHFQEIQARYPLKLQHQRGSNLGERMAHAIQQTTKENCNAVLIGTDCPPLDRSYLIQAFQVLQDGAEAVIGPAEDGGYILIGLRRFNNDIFQDIEWGSDRVLSQTKSKLKQLSINHIELDTLWDVDRPEDLIRLGEYYN
jgi:rSAM/selenodomain-associated transferase 1